MDRYLLVEESEQMILPIKMFNNFAEGKQYCLDNLGEYHDLKFKVNNKTYYLMIINEKKLNFKINK